MKLLSLFVVAASTLGVTLAFAPRAMAGDASVTGQLGAGCAQPSECTSGLCAEPKANAAAVCTQTCVNGTDPCPAGFGCLYGFCFAGIDGGSGTGVDAGIDSGVDAGHDSGVDATLALAECNELLACCPQLPASLQSECTSTVAAEDGTACVAALAAFKAEGSCGASSGGSGSAAGSSAASATSTATAIASDPAATSPQASSGGCTAGRSASTGDGLFGFALGVGLLARRRRRAAP